jgi:hypothetical protein
MHHTQPNYDKILSTLGLSRKSTHLNRSGFQTYTPPNYDGSDLQARDEVHRMSEIVLLHIATGIRLSYLVTESYDGDSAEYSLMRIEVITTDGATHKVVDVDFEMQVVFTENDAISFQGLSKEVEQ